MIEIYEEEINLDDTDAPESEPVTRLVASGDTAYGALCNLVEAINADTIDTENCYLRVREVTPADQFKALGDRLRSEGKLFSCPNCGNERDAGLCITCEEAHRDRQR